MIPSVTYPEILDTNATLFEVHDEIRFRLLSDFDPSTDTELELEGDPDLFMRRVPLSGYVTLTEQGSEIEDRAISLHYSVKDTSEAPDRLVLSGLQLLPGFPSAIKPKRITNVTMNVMAEHHNSLKDALINAQKMLGEKGTVDVEPLGDTIEGRLNYLQSLVFTPKAYFSANKTSGLAPLTIQFQDLSFRTGTEETTGPIVYTWDFGDNSISSISFISVDEDVPSNASNVSVIDVDGGTITKTFSIPGIYDVKLTVSNKYGSDEIVIPKYIHVRSDAPEEAVIEVTPDLTTQIEVSTDPLRIRSPINTLISMEIPDGENPATPGYSYAGELLDGGGNPVDPAVSFTWKLGDDLDHSQQSKITRASYSIGGDYDMKIRIDTRNGAYRITTYPDALDIVEYQNLWMFNYSSGNLVVPYEYGLLSESFKSHSPTYFVNANDDFLRYGPNSDQLRREFARNTGFAQSGVNRSGERGNAVIHYASGRDNADPISSEKVRFLRFNGFDLIFDDTLPVINRPWNWASFSNNSRVFFLLGATNPAPDPFTSPTNFTKTEYALSNFAATSTVWNSTNFVNGATELNINAGYTNPDNFDPSGDPKYGHFSVYRTAWKDNSGYILRNDALGNFFRIKSFYRTEGTLGSLVNQVTKLQDMAGPSKTEGVLSPLINGLHFFNNSGAVSAYETTSDTWFTGGPGINSASFRNLQDQTKNNFDSQSNTLLCASDNDRRAYLSFDYSPNSFIKYDPIDKVFTSLGSRPPGDQWAMGVY